MKKNENVIFTIIAQNYIGYAMTLGKSLRKSNPELDFFIYFADGISIEIEKLLNEYNFHGIDVLKMNARDTLLQMAFYYDVTEYCTSVKPFVISELMDKGYKTVTYIDPDIYVYGSLVSTVIADLEHSNIVLTPHICSPIQDNYEPKEQVHLYSGTYNLGFIAIKNNTVSKSFVDWWIDKCHESCFADPINGLFVDQKWINLVPGMFEGVHISRHLGLNIAYWNLHERKVVDGKINNQHDLIFFHFSGFVTKDINCISKYQNRYTLEDRDDLYPYFENYKNEFDSVVSRLPTLPMYKFLKYSTGAKISLLARRFYFWNKDTMENPLLNEKAEQIFLLALKKNGINEEMQDTSISEPSKINRTARIINTVLRLLQQIIGPNKYLSLCRYFGYLSSINNQKFLMKDYRDIDVVDENRKHIKR